VSKSFVCRGCTDNWLVWIKPDVENLELEDKFCYLVDMLSINGDGDVAVEARLQKRNKSRQLVPLLTSKDVSLL